MKKKQKHSSKRFHGSWLVLFIVVGLTAAAGASFEYFGHAATTCDQTFSSTTSLQTAVSAAGAAGQTICLTAGSYGSITLSGSHASNVTVEPAPTDSSGNALDPNGGGKVTFSSVKVNTNASHITIHNFYITGGVSLGTADSFIAIDHNDITGGGEGITNPSDVNCTALYVPFYSGCTSTVGISNITISGNKIHGYGSGGGEDAIHLNNWHHVTVTANEIYGLEESGNHTDALQSVWSGGDITFDHNYEHDNQAQGFFLNDGEVIGATITDNLFVRDNNLNQGERNIQILNTSGLVIRNNTSWANAADVLRATAANTYDSTVDHNVMQSFFNGCNCDDGRGQLPTNLTEDYDLFQSTPMTINSNNSPIALIMGVHSSLDAHPTFMCGSICGNGTKAGDDYRLASNPNGIGIDWAPSQYTYGPESDSGTSPPPDTTPPTVSISAPASGATVSGTTTLSASASDNVGVSSVQFKLDGANLGSADTTSPYSFSWDTTAVGNGSHTLTAVATDTSNNTATSTSVSVTVNNTTADTTPPTTTISSGPASSTTSTSASFSFTGSDNVTPAGSLTFQCSLDGGTYTACTSPKAYSGLSVGTHSFNVKATDAANNTDASPASQSWTITSGTAVTGDLDGDSHVTGHDLSILLSKYGTSYTLGEFDGGSIVEGHDLSILLSNYGK